MTTKPLTNRELDAWLAENLALGLFDYCNSYEGMGRVLETMRERGWRVLMGTWSVGPGYRCQLYTVTGDGDGIEAQADSLPRAVAEAAKAALGA